MTCKPEGIFRYGSADRLNSQSLPFVVGMGTMFLAMHVSGTNAVFPRMIGELGVSVTTGQWILSSYTLSLSACLLMFGSLGDRIGLVPVYMWGMALFGISSGACALTSEVWGLILFRSVQGVGAAMVSATAVALIGASVAQGRLGRAVGWQAGMTYIGLALGPVTAGFTAQRFGWRVIFAMNVPTAALAVLVASRAPEPVRERGKVETWAAIRYGSWQRILWMSGMVAFMIAVSGKTGQLSGAIWVAVCAGSFLWIDRKSPNPFFGGWITRNRRLQEAVADEIVFYVCLYAAGFLLPLYLTWGRGFTLAQIGVLLGLQNAARAITAAVSGRMSDRFGPGILILLSTVALALAMCLLRTFGNLTSAPAIWGALILLGSGAGLFAPANSTVLLCAAPAEGYGISTSALATARSVGMTLGVALAALLYAAFGGNNNPTIAVYAVREAFTVIAAMAMLFTAVTISLNARELNIIGGSQNSLRERSI